MSEQLEILFPQGKDIVLTGELFTIRPFKLGQIPMVAGVLSSIAAPAQLAVLNGKQSDPATLLKICVDMGPEIINLLAKMLNKPIEFIENLEQDEAVTLLHSVIEVNKDFFAKRVTPLLNQK